MLTQPLAKDWLSSLATVRVEVAQIIDFVLHIVYNLPKREKTPGESKYAMLFVKKGKKKVFIQRKQLPPDKRSLRMKLLRANYISYGWENCLNQKFWNTESASIWMENMWWEIRAKLVRRSSSSFLWRNQPRAK